MVDIGMKLYDGGRAPNPRRVTLFLAEKGVSIETVPVDLGKMEHKAPLLSRLNPLQRLPVLELDNGTVLSESVAICRYIEALHPEPALFGHGALEQALVEMWNRRVELNFFLPVSFAFRHIHPAMKDWENPQMPEWGEANKPKAIEFLRLLDQELGQRRHVAGEAFSIADITAHITVGFMKPAKIAMPEELENVKRWYAEVSARPAFQASAA